MASQKGHNVLPQRVAFESNALLSLANKNNVLIWESNALASKSTRCFSVSRQRVALDFESNALF